tara:strand:+ start:811 stop:1422 length:612 start_codon:yes stop_codon:yes gene_type:complete
MPSLVTYPFKGLKAKIGVTFLTLNEKPECLIISPGGCGTVSLIKYLNKFIKSNNYFEKKYSNVGIGHLYKPNKFLIKNNIKVILIYRDFEGIYKSIHSRGFVRNTLSIFGDLFPFMYINIFKNEKKLKKKYFRYLRNFYSNWENYNKKNILRVKFNDLYKKKDIKFKIKNFLDIKNKNFLKNFPKYKRYIKGKNFKDPSSQLD